MITPLTPAQFRLALPVFKDVAKFPDESITFWADAAAIMLNPRRFGRGLVLAMQMWIAHNVALEALNQAAADSDGIPGIARGVLTSESGGGVSASYDTSATTDPKAGHWNYTTYGQRFARLISFAGMGPLYVGGGEFPMQAFLYGLPLPSFCGPGWRQAAASPNNAFGVVTPGA